MRDSTYAAIGVRLSDNGADQSEIVEVAVVRCTPDAVERPWVSLVRPTWRSDRRSEQLAGIRAEALLGAPSFAQVAERLRAELSEAVPIGHHATVILDQLRQAGAAFGRPPIDTLAIAQVLDPTAPSHELDDLCAAYGIVSEHAHGALADAELSRKLLLALRERWGQLSIDVQAKLIAISRAGGLGSQLRPFIAAMPGVEDVPPLRRPVEPRGRAPAADDAAREEEQPELVKLTGKALAGLTAAVFSGAAGNAGSGMERRDQQLAMAQSMAHVLRGGGLGLIEAGTGVGKSLAYLTPAAIWAVAMGQRVMIATHTKNLQSQLLDSDVARLRGMLAPSLPKVAGALEATVLRGRSNYLCRRNVDRALDAQLDAAGDGDELSELLLARVVVWAEVTSTGDREELRLPESDDREWARLSASGVSCLGDGCPYVEDGACFLDGAYKRAERSHLIIGNQWLLIWSLLVDQSRVPHAHAVIIDEAHFLEDVATDIFGDEVSQSGLQSAVNRAASEHPKRTKTLAQRAQRHGLGQRGSLVAQARRTRAAIAGVWAQLELFYAEIQGEREGEPALRLTAQLREEQGWRHVQRRWETSKAQIERLTDELGELDGAARAGVRNATGDQWSKLRALADDASRVTRSLVSSAESVEKVLAANPEVTVSWLEFAEGRAGGPELTLKAAPLNVGPELRDRLWSRRDERHAIVLTGATLTVGERWDFLRRRLALPTLPAAREAQHGSPFDYERHARIFVARDMPQPPATEPPDEYEAALAEAIPRLTAAANGRTLVLFTSYATMNRVADQVGEALAGQGLELKVQRRDGSAADVANALKIAPRTVTFGVSSLWTGVDIPGEHLSLLIICRMPFDHPDNPVHAARGEQYMNAFGALTLPVAILQLRQGFGRLIRSRSDRGVCVILDPRPGTKSYGGVVRRSLPRKLERASVEEIVEEVGAFLAPDPADGRRRATIGGR